MAGNKLGLYKLNLLDLPPVNTPSHVYIVGYSINHLKHCLARAIREIKHLARGLRRLSSIDVHSTETFDINRTPRFSKSYTPI